jgi:hypothetical protein
MSAPANVDSDGLCKYHTWQISYGKKSNSKEYARRGSKPSCTATLSPVAIRTLLAIKRVLSFVVKGDWRGVKMLKVSTFFQSGATVAGEE